MKTWITVTILAVTAALAIVILLAAKEKLCEENFLDMFDEEL